MEKYREMPVVDINSDSLHHLCILNRDRVWKLRMLAPYSAYQPLEQPVGSYNVSSPYLPQNISYQTKFKVPAIGYDQKIPDLGGGHIKLVSKP